MPRIEHLPTPALEAKRDHAEAAGDWDLMERYEAELERRDYDDSDPAVTAERQDREDAAAGPTGVCWEYQAGQLPVRLSFTVNVF